MKPLSLNPFAGTYKTVYYKMGYEGDLVNEVIHSGSAIVIDNRIVSFTRMGEGPFGYAGHFEANEESFRISVDSCADADLEGQVFDWKFEWESEKDCRFWGKEISTGRDFVMLVRKI